jgi:hypothetical protein
MPWPVSWTIWMYVICIVGTLIAYFWLEQKGNKNANSKKD